VSSNHSHWRSTLRSFPLAFSRSASTASRVRTPSLLAISGNPSPSGHPVRCSATGCRPPRTLPSRRWLQVTQRPVAPQAERPGALSVPFPRPQGLDPSASPLLPPALQLDGRPVLPWASPLKGLLHRRRVAACPSEREAEASALDIEMSRLTVPTKPCGHTGPKPVLPANRLRSATPPTNHLPCSATSSEPPATQQTRPTPAPEGLPPPRG
jgi:hypothetical protein